MDSHISEFFEKGSSDIAKGNFSYSLALHENQETSFDEIQGFMPSFPKGWYELAHLSVSDRIDFVREFWISKLPFHPKISECITQFFSSLDDIGIYLVQKAYDKSYECYLVYSLKNNSGFFYGSPGASDKELQQLKKAFSAVILPADYLAFLQIHNGFSKASDTGILKISIMEDSCKRFQTALLLEEPMVTDTGATINPKSLIPFYESFGMPVYQCFWADWYPESEMGNVYYSGLTKSISDVVDCASGASNMAFPTFLDWLIFYLDKLDVNG